MQIMEMKNSFNSFFFFMNWLLFIPGLKQVGLRILSIIYSCVHILQNKDMEIGNPVPPIPELRAVTATRRASRTRLARNNLWMGDFPAVLQPREQLRDASPGALVTGGKRENWEKKKPSWPSRACSDLPARALVYWIGCNKPEKPSLGFSQHHQILT